MIPLIRLQDLRVKERPACEQGRLRTAMVLLASWDIEVFAHSALVALDVCVLAPEGLEEDWYWAGLLHDIGKITLPPGILRKPGPLDASERKIVEQHALRGAGILQDIGAPLTAVEGARYHHERWDGSGYPFGLRAQQIPPVARAVAVADVYAALTQDRSYRPALAPAQARREVERNAGTLFEPEMVERFFRERTNDKSIS